MAVTIYSTPTCPWCHKAKAFFTEHNIAFIDYNVADDEVKAQEMVDKSGQMAVPVIDIDGEIVVGFDQQKIASLLKIV